MAKKRANGEGSIRKKPNGRWEGRYTQGIDPSTGRAIQKSVSARTQAECKEKLAKAIRDNRGIPVNHDEDGHPGEPRRGLHRGGVVPAVV